jgi:hypothetical protein
MALPFGETLPHGAYVIYVNVAGEVAKRNAIYRATADAGAAAGGGGAVGKVRVGSFASSVLTL